MIDILYFASLRDAIGIGKEKMEVTDINTLADLIEKLQQRGGKWSTAFGDDAALLMSVNREMSNPQAVINDGDEIGFFPPVTGG